MKIYRHTGGFFLRRHFIRYKALQQKKPPRIIGPYGDDLHTLQGISARVDYLNKQEFDNDPWSIYDVVYSYRNISNAPGVGYATVIDLVTHWHNLHLPDGPKKDRSQLSFELID